MSFSHGWNGSHFKIAFGKATRNAVVTACWSRRWSHGQPSDSDRILGCPKVGSGPRSARRQGSALSWHVAGLSHVPMPQRRPR